MQTGDISLNAYEATSTTNDIREGIMQDIRDSVAGMADGGNEDMTVSVSLRGTEVDISTGAGALLLDDTLQTLSTIEQSAAQILASNNRAVKEINQTLR